MPKRPRCRSSSLRQGLASRILRKTGVGLRFKCRTALTTADAIFSPWARSPPSAGAKPHSRRAQAAEVPPPPPSPLPPCRRSRNWPTTRCRFGDGPLERQARQNHRLVLGLDEDALLRPFRVRAGLRASGHELGGWYDTYAFAPGATFGQWMSALSRVITRSPAMRQRAPKCNAWCEPTLATIDARGSSLPPQSLPRAHAR